jgi:RNA polymerase sigma-70 factor (ECF subfamily)
MGQRGETPTEDETERIGAAAASQRLWPLRRNHPARTEAPLAVHPQDSAGERVSISATSWQLGCGVTAASERSDGKEFIEELFALHHAEIYAYIYRMVRDSEVAADFSQDTFIKAYRAQASLEDRTKARAWLYQIAHRVVLDEMRRRRIVRFLPWTGESHGAAPSAEHLAMEMRLSGPLARALARIPERQRAALLLAEVNDLTGLELAETLGVSHVAARALLTRARESLRQALADEKRQEQEHEAAIDATYADRARGAEPRRPTDDTTGPRQ